MRGLQATATPGRVLIWSAAARYSATPLWLVIKSIAKESGVAEYLAAALQIEVPPTTLAFECVAPVL
jgi:hypothetical protein